MKRATMLVVILALATFVSAQDTDATRPAACGSGASRTGAAARGETSAPGQDTGRV